MGKALIYMRMYVLPFVGFLFTAVILMEQINFAAPELSLYPGATLLHYSNLSMGAVLIISLVTSGGKGKGNNEK